MTADTSLVIDRQHDGAPSSPPSPPEPGQAAAGGLSARTAVIAVAALISIAVGVALFIGNGDSPTDTKLPAASAPSTRPASPFSLPDLRGASTDVSLTASPGTLTVVNFFAAWCEPCKRELPALRAAAAANPGVRFVGVDHQDSREDAVELLDRFAIPYPAGFDPSGDVAARYGVRGLPATFFIDANGRILSAQQGELSPKQLEQHLAGLTLKKVAA